MGGTGDGGGERGVSGGRGMEQLGALSAVARGCVDEVGGRGEGNRPERHYRRGGGRCAGSKWGADGGGGGQEMVQLDVSETAVRGVAEWASEALGRDVQVGGGGPDSDGVAEWADVGAGGCGYVCMADGGRATDILLF